MLSKLIQLNVVDDMMVDDQPGGSGESSDEKIERLKKHASAVRKSARLKKKTSEDYCVRKGKLKLLVTPRANLRKGNNGNETPAQKRQRLSAEATKKRVAKLNKKRINNYAVGCGLFEDFDEDNVTEHYAGKMDVLCKFCLSKNFEEEKNTLGYFNKCCHNGKVHLPPTKPVPEILKHYLTMDKSFMEAVR